VTHAKNKDIGTLQKRLLAWYSRHRRDLPWRRSRDPYAIWVSEVMLQQTQVVTVIPYFTRFLAAFPDVASLAEADIRQVLKLWEGMGYYARARNLHRAAGEVCRDHRGRIPEQWDRFHRLPGVGDYIAAAVLSIAFGQPHAVVDGNVKRVLARVFRMTAPVNESRSHRVFQETAGRLLDRGSPGTFNQAVMELGALICTPRSPACPRCPLREACSARAAGEVERLPRRLARKAAPLYRIAVGVVVKKGRVLITQRKSEGLLGGLWEFPGGKIKANETPAQACVREIREEVNLEVAVVSRLAAVKHAYSHFRIQMEVFICRHLGGRVRLSGPVAFAWVTAAGIDCYPLPKANHKFLAALKRELGRPGD